MFAAGKTKAVASASGVYIEDLFSTFLYNGNGGTNSIVNNIDLSTNGGMVWIKSRNQTTENTFFDTTRGIQKYVTCPTLGSQTTDTTTLTSFNTTGFTLGSDSNIVGTNTSGYEHCSWTFRKQAKFFDVVTYTGTGSNTTIAHNLGSVPGCIIIKQLNATRDWAVYHGSLANTQYLAQNHRLVHQIKQQSLPRTLESLDPH